MLELAQASTYAASIDNLILLVAVLVGGVDALDFGDVQVGHCREMYVVLANPKEVNAEWKATRPLEQAKDWGFFACDPPEGTLAPGDVIAANHPAAGGSHLPDITVITPVFAEGAAANFSLAAWRPSK